MRKRPCGSARLHPLYFSPTTAQPRYASSTLCWSQPAFTNRASSNHEGYNIPLLDIHICARCLQYQQQSLPIQWCQVTCLLMHRQERRQLSQDVHKQHVEQLVVMVVTWHFFASNLQLVSNHTGVKVSSPNSKQCSHHMPDLQWKITGYL